MIYTVKDFYLYKALNERIELLKSAGLVDFWHFQDIEKRFGDEKEKMQPKVLKLSHFVGSFQILLIGWVISFVRFCVEIIKNLKINV